MASSIESSSQSGIVKQFARLWDEGGQPPDVFSFLSQVKSPSPRLQADVLLIDQDRRWKLGDGLPVERYFAAFPAVAAQSRLMVELAVGEFRCREACSQPTDLEGFAKRFPKLQVDLRMRLLGERTSEGMEYAPTVSSDDQHARSDDPLDGALASPDEPAPYAGPARIGRYRVEKALGRGGFGTVYLAYDDVLRRPVALKVPHPDRVASPQGAERYIQEAQVVASLEHPRIVPVYDVGQTDDGLCFIVSKFIEGEDLATKMRVSRPEFPDSAKLISVIADAIHFAHTHGVVHRDVKPANILLDRAGEPYLADFGIALKDEHFGTGAQYVGTPAYMSPEQIRGEGHLVDGRTDVFSLGVVLYELLTGKRPFRERKSEPATEVDARPPRQLDDSIPKALERICLKALSTRATDRYTTARDFADDLRYHLEYEESLSSPDGRNIDSARPRSRRQPSGSGLGPAANLGQPDSTLGSTRIVPKGLRSFDASDAGFFLDLMPGPRDRDGVPESLRFWQNQVKRPEADQSFRVGLIYGPSGCGKSSFVKAGLLPRLGGNIWVIYIEATPHQTEDWLLRELRKRVPGLGTKLDLSESIADLRRGNLLPSGVRVLVVIDQFEQWLHANEAGADAEMVRALRQCDGQHVQCLLLVRDDFWMGITAFMRELEVELVPGRNVAAVDLFGRRHAQKVLAAFGRAYGALPDHPTGLGPAEEMFLRTAVGELAEQDKVIPVRLALFAEMVKDRPWDPETLKSLGGTEGIGVRFLEETFSGPSANPEHRFYQGAARAVLKSLMPEHAGDIKGSMRSEDELLAASGYPVRGRDYRNLMRILDHELRLITPTDPASSSDGARTPVPAGAADQKYYHLAHDYLVPSLREWLTRKQRETARGRAQIRLEDRTAAWKHVPTTRNLPSWWEWLDILAFTRRRDRAEDDDRRRMFRAATQHYVLLMGFILGVLLLGVAGFYELHGRFQARALVDRLASAQVGEVPNIVEGIDEGYRGWANPLLREMYTAGANGSRERLYASLALFPVDPGQQDYLYQCMLDAPADEFTAIRDGLEKWAPREKLIGQLWKLLLDDGAKLPHRFRAGAALARLAPDRLKAADPSAKIPEFLAQQLLSHIAGAPSDADVWMDAFDRVASGLVTPLGVMFRRKDAGQTELYLVAVILAEYAADDPDELGRLMLDANLEQYRVLQPKFFVHKVRAVRFLDGKLTAPQPAAEVTDWSQLNNEQKAAIEDEKDVWARHKAHAAEILMRMDQGSRVRELLVFQPDPRVRTYLIHRLATLGTEADELIARLEAEQDASVRQALILSLGGYSRETLSQLPPELLVQLLAKYYSGDPDPGIHSASEWALRKLGARDRIAEADKALRAVVSVPDRRWIVSAEGHTLAVFDGPIDYQLGSPLSEPGRDDRDERQHLVHVPRSFAVATKEVTMEQYLRSRPDFEFPENQKAPSPSCPVNAVTWVDAVEYCRWLSREEGIPEAEWVYPPDLKIEIGMTLPADFIKRAGYRLPTEIEWEYACRGGATTRFNYGNDPELLREYCWYFDNSNGRSQPVGLLKPNRDGVFDVHGNIREWCHDIYWLETDPVDDGEHEPLREPPFQNVSRGGNYSSSNRDLRSANRRGDFPTREPYLTIGFRVARTVAAKD